MQPQLQAGAPNSPMQEDSAVTKEVHLPPLRGRGNLSPYEADVGVLPAVSAFGCLGPPREERYLGHNTVLCNGRVVLGPDLKVAAAACCLIWVPTVLFFAIMSPRMPFYWSLVQAALVVAATVFLFQTATTDPGILRRNHVPPSEQDVLMQVSVPVEGEAVQYRYCRTCFIYRDPRASHCHVCDNCVERFDHHCPWTGTCIGLHNYRFFCRFLVAVISLAVYDILCSTLVVVFKFQEMGGEGLGLYWEAQKSFWVIPLILGIYCALILICVAPLCGFHMYLIGTAQTTREAFKDEPASRSSYSRGLLRNFHDICCFHDNPFPRPPGPTPPDLPVEMQPRPQPALFV